VKYLLTIYLFQTVSVPQTIQDYFFEGNDAIMNSNYDEAIDAYKRILDYGFESSDLYHNLGNAHFRIGNIGKAIWAYNKSLMLNPREEDVKYNLSIAEARVIDQIEIPKDVPLIKLYSGLKMYFTTREWFLLCSLLTLFTCFIHSILNAKISIGKAIQKTRFMLIILTLITHFIGFDSYFSNKYANNAVIVKNFVDVFSEPRNDNNKPLFRIHEGTVVDVANRQNGWSEISLIDGNKGWVKAGTIMVLK